MLIYNYFREEEFRCKHCGQLHISDDLVRKLDKAREIANVPFRITSGYRCLEHNRAIGSKDSSPHLQGVAVDIYCPDAKMRFKILNALLTVGFTRIGIGKDFIHCDIDKRESKIQNIIWHYYK